MDEDFKKLSQMKQELFDSILKYNTLADTIGESKIQIVSLDIESDPEDRWYGSDDC